VPTKEPLEPVAAKPVQLVLEAVTAAGQTAVGQVFNGFTLDGKALLETDYRVIAGKERPLDSLKPGKLERLSFSGIYGNFWEQVSQFGKAAQAGQRGVRTGSAGVQ
jgi:hypothetical protein